MSRQSIVYWVAIVVAVFGLTCFPADAEEGGKPSPAPGADVSTALDSRLATEVFAGLPNNQTLAPSASDEIFLRRVFLDLVGVPPTPGEVRSFVRDEAKNKRAAKIAMLLDDPRFGVNMANYWRDVLL